MEHLNWVYPLYRAYSKWALTLFRQTSTWAVSSSGDPTTLSLHTGHTVSSGRFLRLRLLAALRKSCNLHVLQNCNDHAFTNIYAFINIYLQIFTFKVKCQFLYFSSLLSLIYSMKNLFLSKQHQNTGFKILTFMEIICMLFLTDNVLWNKSAYWMPTKILNYLKTRLFWPGSILKLTT